MSKVKECNHIYADDDSELDNICEDCGEFLDRHGKCQNCIDNSKADTKYDAKKDDNL